jgi:hypothetical protein
MREGESVTGSGRGVPAREDQHSTFDTSVAHLARVYDYWLGGKDNYAADRAAGDAAMQAYPDLVHSVRANRAFLARAVRYLAAEAGIRQFLDIGTGIPSASNTHEVAQAVAPSCRVVYVDNDPVVLAHARALLTSSPEGATCYIDADLRDTGAVMSQAARELDFSQPVAVMLIAVLHVIGDDDDPYGIVGALMDGVPAGSYLTVSHAASDIVPAQASEMVERLNRVMAQQGILRTQAQVARFFGGLELAEPGVVRVQDWRPDSDIAARTPSNMWGGLGRKN